MKKSIVQIQAIDPNQDYLDIEGNLKTIGTGFFIDKKGLILTCAHVIDNQSKDILKNGIYVKLEGETFKAKRVDDEYIPELNIKNNNKFQYDISVLSIEIDKETQKNISPFPILKPPKKRTSCL